MAPTIIPDVRLVADLVPHYGGIWRRISGRSGSANVSPAVIGAGRFLATVIPGSSQSNRDRAELVALWRLETVEDCAKVVEFLAPNCPTV